MPRDFHKCENDSIMEWPSQSSNANPIKNIWSIMNISQRSFEKNKYLLFEAVILACLEDLKVLIQENFVESTFRQ